MSRRKALDKTQIRERRDRMLESAAAAKLSLTEGVREMRAISGMTQEEFARHRGVSARVIKAIELGQGNPTMATMNRISQFFGLEVGFVPIRREMHPAADSLVSQRNDHDMTAIEIIRYAIEERNKAVAEMQRITEMLAGVDSRLLAVSETYAPQDGAATPPMPSVEGGSVTSKDAAAGGRRIRLRGKQSSS